MFNFNHWGGTWQHTSYFLGETFTGYHKCNFGEMGVGYYLPFKNKIVFEAYGGVGIGKVENKNDIYINSTVNYNRYFIQPAAGFYHKNIKLIISTRFCGLDYKNIGISGSNNNSSTEIIYLKDHPFSFLIEPAFTFRAGWEFFKFQTQVGYSIIINNPEFPYDPLNLNLGLIVTIPAKNDPAGSN